MNAKDERIDEYTDEEAVEEVIPKIETSIQKIFNEGKLIFNIGNSEFIIQSNFLRIVKYQIHVLKEQGILKKNSNNIFDTSCRSDIYVDIYLS